MNGAQSLASISAIWWCGWWSSCWCCEDGRSVIEDCHGERGAGCAGTRGPLPFYELILCCQLGWLHIVFIEYNIALCWRPYHEGLAPFSHKAGSLNHWLKKRLGDRSNGWIRRYVGLSTYNQRGQANFVNYFFEKIGLKDKKLNRILHRMSFLISLSPQVYKYSTCWVFLLEVTPRITNDSTALDNI